METPQEHRRSQRRVETSLPIRVHGMDSAGQEFDDTTHAVDVSRRGLSFVTSHNVALFATLTIVIPGRGPIRPGEGPSDFLAEATVVRSARDEDGAFHVAIRFRGATLPMYSPETA